MANSSGQETGQFSLALDPVFRTISTSPDDRLAWDANCRRPMLSSTRSRRIFSSCVARPFHSGTRSLPENRPPFRPSSADDAQHTKLKVARFSVARPLGAHAPALWYESRLRLDRRAGSRSRSSSATFQRTTRVSFRQNQSGHFPCCRTAIMKSREVFVEALHRRFIQKTFIVPPGFSRQWPDSQPTDEQRNCSNG